MKSFGQLLHCVLLVCGFLLFCFMSLGAGSSRNTRGHLMIFGHLKALKVLSFFVFPMLSAFLIFHSGGLPKSAWLSSIAIPVGSYTETSNQRTVSFDPQAVGLALGSEE